MAAPLIKRTKPSTYHRTIDVASILVFIGFLMLFISDGLGLRFNRTRSVAPGFYWVIQKKPEKGDFVSFCPAESPLTRLAIERGYFGFGNCPGHVERLLKIVVGCAGDNISVNQYGVLINGTLLAQSAPLTMDGLERPLASFSAKPIPLKPDELWVMTDHNRLSFDSRYFGPIRSEQVSDVVKPLWTWR